MGELADRMERFGVASNSHPQGDAMRWHSERWGLRDAIAELEAERDRLRADVAFEQSINARLDAADVNVSRERAAAALARLADAEQRAAAAWAAVTELLATNGEIAAIADVDEVSDCHDSSGWRCQLLLSNATNIPEFRRRKLRVAVIEPLSADPNPDLLERASVELAETYQRAKAEEQRQAEAAADAKENAAFRATPKDPDADAVTFTMRTWP